MTRIADGHRCDQWFKQFIEPGGVSAFFKDHFDFAAYAAEEVSDVFALCFDLRSALELAEFIQNNNHGNRFVDIHAHILDIAHRTPPCCW
jgi:hypothetical protein